MREIEQRSWLDGHDFEVVMRSRAQRKVDRTIRYSIVFARGDRFDGERGWVAESDHRPQRGERLAIRRGFVSTPTARRSLDVRVVEDGDDERHVVTVSSLD